MESNNTSMVINLSDKVSKCWIIVTRKLCWTKKFLCAFTTFVATIFMKHMIYKNVDR